MELVPDRRLVVTWNFPPSLPTLRDGRTLVTVELEPLDGGRTRVTLRQVGFRRGAEWDEGFAYFERAWNLVLERLVRPEYSVAAFPRANREIDGSAFPPGRAAPTQLTASGVAVAPSGARRARGPGTPRRPAAGRAVR